MFSYKGDVYPVNPKYDRVGGLKCYPKVTDIDGPVDLAVIGVAAAQVMTVLRDCAAKKVGSVIIFTSGFAEVSAEGREEQAEMRKLAQESGMRTRPGSPGTALFYYPERRAWWYYIPDDHATFNWF